jgi:hypothetical protein
LKLTVDSTEPIEDALRVVGALYGVTIAVSEDGQYARKASQRRTSKPRKGSVGTNRRTRSGEPDKASGRARKPKSSGSAARPTNADVRSWARQTGLSVSERGRVPASVLAAYRDAH